jgi:hypothetical protein
LTKKHIIGIDIVTRVRADLIKDNLRSYSDKYFRSQYINDTKDEYFFEASKEDKRLKSNILFGFRVLDIRDFESHGEMTSVHIEEEESVLSRALDHKKEVSRRNIKRFFFFNMIID